MTVPRTEHRYDEGIASLGATFWSNPSFVGGAKSHATGPGGSGPSGPGCPAGTLCTQWTAPPVTPDGGNCCGSTGSAFSWSMRLDGIIDLPTATSLRIATTQHAVMYVDDSLVLDVDAVLSANEGNPAYGQWLLSGDSAVVPAGRHRVRIDYQGATSTLNGLWLGTTTGWGYVTDAMLSPDYGLETTTIDPDGKIVATSYADAATGIGPEHGLATAVTQDPYGLALTTRSTYESPGVDRWLRKTSSTLPAGNTTTYQHYCGRLGGPCSPEEVPGAIAAACGVPAGGPQYGQMAQRTYPGTAVGQPGRSEQFLYDRSGRTAGRRVGPSDTIGSLPWECTSYDTRGRVTSKSFPAVGSAHARTVTYSFLVGGSTLTTSVSDPVGTITSTVDLLGRVTSYTDVWGRTTAYQYDTAGRTTNVIGPNGWTQDTYGANSSKLTSVTADTQSGGSMVATSQLTYDGPTGLLTTVDYGAVGGSNSKRLSIGYDDHLRQVSTVFTNVTGSGPARIAGDEVSRSPAGRVIDQFVETGAASLVDPNPGGLNFVYDGAGRLTTAHLPGGRGDYGYAATPVGDGCVEPGAGRNTNRTSISWTPTAGAATTTRSCFNRADQLTSTIVGSSTTGTMTYDTRGNQVTSGTDTYTWDSADRLARLTPASGGRRARAARSTTSATRWIVWCCEATLAASRSTPTAARPTCPRRCSTRRGR